MAVTDGLKKWSDFSGSPGISYEVRDLKSLVARTKKATFSLFTSVAMSNYLYAISELCSVKIALLRYEVHQKKSQREESIV